MKEMHPNALLSLGVSVVIVFYTSSAIAYTASSGYARPADLERTGSGSAFGAAETSHTRTAASYARPASVSGGYQPSSVSSGYDYGNGGSQPAYSNGNGNGKRKPVGLGGQTSASAYGGYVATSGYPGPSSYGGGTRGPSYSRPATVPFSSAGRGVPSVPAGGAHYPSYPSDAYESGAGVSRPHDGNGYVPSSPAGGCNGQEPATSGCPSEAGGQQLPSRPAEPYDGGSIAATSAPYDGGYPPSGHSAARQPDGGCADGGQTQPAGGCPSTSGAGQFGGNGRSDHYEGGGAPSPYDGNGHAAHGHANGCPGGGGAEQAGCEHADGGRTTSGMPQVPSTSFSRSSSSGFRGSSGHTVSTTYSDYGSHGYTQHRGDDSYRGAGNGRTLQREGAYMRPSAAASSVPAYPSSGGDYSHGAHSHNGGHANGNGYYDSAKAKDYGGSSAAASYARPAGVADSSGGYSDTGAGWPARDAYPSGTTSYSRPSGVSSPATSANGYAHPSYDTSSGNGARGYEYPHRGAPAYDAGSGRTGYSSSSNGGYVQGEGYATGYSASYPTAA